MASPPLAWGSCRLATVPAVQCWFATVAVPKEGWGSFTWWPESFVIAWLPRPRAAATFDASMLPPFKVSASAAMPMPLRSTSAAITV